MRLLCGTRTSSNAIRRFGGAGHDRAVDGATSQVALRALARARQRGRYVFLRRASQVWPTPIAK